MYMFLMKLKPGLCHRRIQFLQTSMQESFATILVLHLLRFAGSLLGIFKNGQTTSLYDMQLSE